MDKQTREAMERIWGKDWDKITLAERIADIDWRMIIRFIPFAIMALGLICILVLLIALL